jgi:hypothetical protein
MPLYYASLSSLWVYYRVDLEIARRHVAAAPGLDLALFDGAPIAALNFQRYTSHGDSFLAGAGSFPTAGTASPTLTLAALAFRSVERMARDLAGNGM